MNNTSKFYDGVKCFRIGNTSISCWDSGQQAKRFRQTFMCKLKNYLTDKGLNCKIAENDLLVDGYKCGSYMSRNIDGVIYTAIHISINMDVDLIKSICTKPMVKIPKGLSEFGITTDEIKNFIIKMFGE